MGHAGDPHAQLLLGEAYRRFNKPGADSSQAIAWYARAAGQGLAEARYQLAELYLESDQPPGRAIDLLMRAAEQGHPAANLTLGTFYQLGEHVSRNHRFAKTYYEAAANKGNVTARNNLAWLLATSPEPGLRDGERAVTLAEPVAITFDSWGYLDTLAAAWAERGDFTEAVRTQQRAIKLAEPEADPATLAALRERLKRFEAKQPYREP
jgi:TPR repeat protein